MKKVKYKVNCNYYLKWLLLLRMFVKGRRWIRRGLSRLLHYIWEEETKRKFAKCGRGVRLNGHMYITGHSQIEIGDNVHIGSGAFIRGEGGLKIGSNAHISRNLVLYTFNHNYEGTRFPYDEKKVFKPVTIGRNVWIGMNVCIVPGVTIGDGAIVGMGTVVSKDVPPLAIVGSSPPVILKYRDPAHYKALEEARKFGGRNGQPYDYELH